MRLHIFQHEAGCGPGHLLDWATARGVELCWLRFHEGATVPALDEVEAAVILGGSMNTYQDGDYSHLRSVREWTRAALLAGKKVFGICLGAQIMADALGSQVVRATKLERGWIEVSRLPQATKSPLLNWLPEQQFFFSWHGDTFVVPEGALHGASSADCLAQAFAWGKHALAVQFHPEADASIVEGWIADEPASEQAALRTQLLPAEERFESQKRLCFAALDVWALGFSS